MPTRNDYFNEFRDAELSGASGVARKVGHSFANYFQTIDRTTFGFGGGSKVEAVLKGANNGAAALGLGGMGAGIAMLCSGALASAAAIAALSGPQAAVTGGVIAIVMLAKSTYSNREAAHVGVTKYCWSLIDDMPPLPFANQDILNEAANAAMTLMDDGKNQIKLLGTKLDAAKSKLGALNEQLRTNEMTIGNMVPRGTRVSGAQLNKIIELKTKNEELITAAKRQGGAIYEYTRRVIHTSNYIQAAHITALSMKEKASPGSVLGKTQPDYWANTILGTSTRKLFTDLAAIYSSIVTPPTDRTSGATMVGASAGRAPTMPRR